jgi:hypothetical protein
LICRTCGNDLEDDAQWTLLTTPCPYCGQLGPCCPPEVRVAALSRQAASELRIFLGTVAAVVGLCWAIVYLIEAIPRWRGRPAGPYLQRSTRRDGPDYYLRNVVLSPSRMRRPLTLPRTNNPLDAILSYPVQAPDDVARVYDTAVGRDRPACPSVGFPAFSDALHRTSGCLIAAVANTRDMPYSLWLLDFAKSRTRVLQVLREELAIPPPAGHAVIRIFEPGDPLPEPLAEFHQASPEIAGASFGGPYIAVFNADQGLDSVVAHELVHAYLSTVMGRAGERLPPWFHEGVALSLARTPLTATVDAGGDLRFSTLTAQYQEYKHVFDRIERRLGRPRYLALIRDCIAQRSERPVLTATASKDYADLMRFANAWVFADARPFLLMMGAGVTVALGNFVRRRWKRRRAGSDREKTAPASATILE